VGGKTPQTTGQNEKSTAASRAENSAQAASARVKRGPGRPFPKGVSGNPKGRPPASAVIHAFLDTVVRVGGKSRGGANAPRREQILTALFKTATSGTARDQIKAAELLLAYDFGRPRERVEMSGPRGGPIETADTTRPKKMTTGEMRKELEAIEARRKERMAKTGTRPAADVPAEGTSDGPAPGTPEPIPDEPPAEDDAGGPPSGEDSA
jgi:hypothetical protein